MLQNIPTCFELWATLVMQMCRPLSSFTSSRSLQSVSRLFRVPSCAFSRSFTNHV